MAERSSQLMRGLGAVGGRHVEVHPGVRVHEVDLRDDARELDVLVHREVAETVMGVGRRGENEARGEQTRGHAATVAERLVTHAFSLKYPYRLAPIIRVAAPDRR